MSPVNTARGPIDTDHLAGVDLSRVVIGLSGDTAVTPEQIDVMLIDNPSTIFERRGGL